MPLSWQLFRIVCLLQLAGSVYFFFRSLIATFQVGDWLSVFSLFCFAAIIMLSAFSFNLINSNYPDKPVAGKQKSWFNWLFLLNFLLLTFLFTLFFSSLRSYNQLHTFLPNSMIPSSFKWMLASTSLLLILQLILLFGLYNLRRLLFINAYKIKQFEFEEKG